MATGESHTVAELATLAFSHVGLDYRDHVTIDEKLFRPGEVDILQGDASLGEAAAWMGLPAQL